MLYYKKKKHVFDILFSYEISWGPIVWIVCSEIYPTRVRAISLSITTAFNWAMNATIAKVTPIMMNDITYGTYFFFGAMSVVMGTFAYVFLPETRGRSLEEIDEVKTSQCWFNLFTCFYLVVFPWTNIGI